MNGKTIELHQYQTVDLEAEQAVLGALLLEPKALHEVNVILKTEYFQREAHRKIYQAILDIDLEGKPVDLTTVTARLYDLQILDDIGGPVFLASLSDHVGSAANVAHYARRVRDKAALVKVREVGESILNGLRKTPIPTPAEFLDWAESELFQVGQEFRTNSRSLGISSLVQAESEALQEIFETKSLPGLATGFLDLDQLFSWRPGDLSILAGRTSMGKTALALNLALRAAQSGAQVGICSLEMSASQLTRRLLASQGRIDADRLNRVKLTSEEWAALHKAKEELAKLPITINETPSLSVLEIRSEARRARAQDKLDLLIVDYLQLVRPFRRGRTREEEVAETCRGLKILAGELKIPILTVAQLNRKCEERPNKRPKLSDLRESGAIENDADIVLFLYRDEYYHNDSPEKGLAEVNVAKNRNGRTGMAKLVYQEQFLRFDDYIGFH